MDKIKAKINGNKMAYSDFIESKDFNFILSGDFG